ncbi:MAG: T9SS type A sorting domain-containing protein [Bacteroidetes bacterium]|nr:T9SS type A sorting domain-containing protein [Bacteroidota bacterium]
MFKAYFVSPWWVIVVVGLMIQWPAFAQNQVLNDLNSLTVEAENRCSTYTRSHYSYPQSVEPQIVEAQGGAFSPYDYTCFSALTESDIEHITATSEAHDSGMCGRTREEKRTFARDLLNLTLATPSLNRHQKGAKDAAEWVPANNKCWFAATIIATKKKYSLSIDQDEKTALNQIISDCTTAGTGFTMEVPSCEVKTAIPQLTINDVSANEGLAISFTVTLDQEVSGGFTVTPNYTDGTATKGTDYTVNTQAISFTGTANETQTITVSTTEDDLVEADETFTVGLTVSGTTETITATDTGTGTIVNDDIAPTPTVTINNASANEGDVLTFTITLDNPVSGGFSVTPNYTDGTATKGTDYTVNTQAISFQGTENETKTFAVSTTEDDVVEADETFIVGLTISGTSETITAADTGTGTIVNDDVAPTPAVTINNASADEGDALTFTITLDNAVSGGFSVTPNYTDGTATKGTDYTVNTQAISFQGTENETKSFTVSTTQDDVVETDESFTVGLTISGTSETITAADTGTGTIVNDDVAPTPTVTINNASAEEGDALTFTITLDNAVSGGFTVTPNYTDGTATEGTDYAENIQVISFTGTVNETKTFAVSTTEDDEVEADETFTVGLTISGTSEIITATDTGTGTIVNDDVAPTPTVTINNASADEGDALTFTVTLDKAVTGGFTITPNYTDGTAIKGTDYTENTQSITFTGTANETKTFAVSTTQDDVVETDETFTVGLTISGTSETITATDTGTGTIVNDDEAPTPTVTINNASADEGDALTFTITLDKTVTGGFTITPNYTDGTATKGTDYTENIQAISFTGTANETKIFTVSTTEDELFEADETFTVGLTISGTSETITATDTGTGTIVNDDVAPTPTVTINNASAEEGDALTFTVTLDKAVTGGFTITPNYTDGTATKGTDYTENIQAISFTGTANETKTFTVSTTEDELVEADETFIIGLAISGTSQTITTTDTGTGTIVDDDVAPTPSVTINNASANEGDALSFTVTLDLAVAGGFVVTPNYTDGTATKGTDYTENIQAINFNGAANETRAFTVYTIDDVLVESDETFTVGLTVSGTAEAITATDTGTGTIVNNDIASTPSVTINHASTSEGDPLIFTITLDHAVSGGFTVTPSFTDSTANEGNDYTKNTQPISFKGVTNETMNFKVDTIEDELYEAEEIFIVDLNISGTNQSITIVNAARGTIENDDHVIVTFSVTPNPVTEGNSVTAHARLSTAMFSDLILPLLFTTKTAETTDYQPLSSITIPKDQTIGSGIITTVVDDDSDDEVFTIRLGNLPPDVLEGETGSIEVTILDQGTPTSIESSVKSTKPVFALEQNYPNPFNPTTSIEFSLNETQHVTLHIYDMLGQKVHTLIDGVQSQGRNHVVFSATGLSSSKYVYVLQTEQNIAFKVMTLLK